MDELQKQLNEQKAQNLFMMQHLDIMRDENRGLIDALAQARALIDEVLSVYYREDVQTHTISFENMPTQNHEEKLDNDQSN